MDSNSQSSEPSVDATPALAAVTDAAESLRPDDRMRLIARLWESLPTRNRAAIVAYGIENVHRLADEAEQREQLLPPTKPPQLESIWPVVWAFLFDPAQTSGLYSAPRRFDLTTIFVVTAAYSIVFGVMSSLNHYGRMTYFGPVTQAGVGVFITVVAMVQALYHHQANPRGVSIVAGAVTQTAIVSFLAMMHWYYEPFLIVLVGYGMIGGAICGYLAGTVVGGVFLIADFLRGKLERPSTSRLGDNRPDDAE
jgi:hypothetical protein